MPLQLGIGVATYNRRDYLERTLNHIALHTKYPFTAVAVVDDGSTDGTPDMLRGRNATFVTGQNMGIAWNKNRALFLLSELQRCDIVILLEDDSFPIRDGWETEWMDAALRWGHSNLAGDWMSKYFVSGTGTLEDPLYSTAVTAQCSVFTREALLFGGYFDPRFRGYGHEHVEHTARMIRVGYGGIIAEAEGRRQMYFRLLYGGIKVTTGPSYLDKDQVARNVTFAKQALHDHSFRAPWHTEDDMRQFRDEMRAASPRVL